MEEYKLNSSIAIIGSFNKDPEKLFRQFETIEEANHLDIHLFGAQVSEKLLEK